MMNVAALFASLLVLVLQSGTGSSIDGFYLGTFTSAGRTLDVGVTVTAEGNVVSGEYFYFGTSEETISLKGTIGADLAIRMEEVGSGGKVTGRWVGRAVGSGLQGTWTNVTNNRQWTFELTRSDEATAYFVDAPQTRETGSGPITFRTARVPASDHKVPQITMFRDRRVIADVNAALMSDASAAHCEDRSRDDVEFDAVVNFTGASLLSVEIRKSWFCGAAYPTLGADMSLVYDLSTARVVSYDDLFRRDATKEQIVTVLFAYELSRAAGGASSMLANTDQIECLDNWSLKAIVNGYIDQKFHLTEEGLVVRLELAHVIAFCANDVTVPYRALESVAAPDGPLPRLAKAFAGKPIRYRIHRSGDEAKDDIFYVPQK
jgi:hypothetical protein